MIRVPRGAARGAVVLAIAAAMGVCVLNGFVFDDIPIIVQNTRVTDPHLWYQIPGATYWLATLWRPLTVMGFALQWWAAGGQPWLFHAISLALYVACGCLLLRLLADLAIPPVVALVVTVAFVVHPVHVEVVASVVGQGELWATLALTAATLLYIRLRRSPPSTGRLIALLAVIAAGILAKEQGFVAVFLLAGAEWLVLGKEGERFGERVRYLVPVAALTALLLLVRNRVAGGWAGEIPAPPLAHLDLGGRVTTFLGVVPEYARLLIWPLHLSADYNPPQIPVGGPIAARHILGAALMVLSIGAFLLARRRNPVAAFGLWWVVVTLAPVSNIPTPSGILMAERVFFLPTVGFAIACAAGATAIAAATTRQPVLRLATALCVAWIVAATIRSAIRVPVWHDQATFMEHFVADAPMSYRAALVVGSYWRTQEQPAKAESELRRALSLRSDDVRVHIVLANLLLKEQRCPEAIPIFIAGLRQLPDEPILRSGLVQCQIAVRDWPNAERTARIGIALGQTALQNSLERIQRAEKGPE